MMVNFLVFTWNLHFKQPMVYVGNIYFIPLLFIDIHISLLGPMESLELEMLYFRSNFKVFIISLYE